MKPETYPIKFNLKDGTHVAIYKESDDSFEFFLTKLNSEKHNFILVNGKIEESYETRFDMLQSEAIEIFNSMNVEWRRDKFTNLKIYQY